MPSDANSGDAVTQCDENWTQDSTPIETNPAQGLEVFSDSIFDTTTKTCVETISSNSNTPTPINTPTSTLTISPTSNKSNRPTPITVPTFFNCIGSCPTPTITITTTVTDSPTISIQQPSTGNGKNSNLIELILKILKLLLSLLIRS